MGIDEQWRKFVKRILRRHRDIKSFEHEIRAAGGEAARVDRGVEEVPTSKIVGSVSRWRNLRSDFFYRHGKAPAPESTLLIRMTCVAGRSTSTKPCRSMKPCRAIICS